jgi:hypothetical protein
MSGVGAVPPIRRARDYHLYDERGRRYLDLYQNGGRAVLSHRPPGLAKRIKGVVDQGLWGSFPSVYESRLERVLGELIPGYPLVRVYAHAARAVEIAGGEVADPAVATAAGTPTDRPTAAWWRPFLPASSDPGDGERPQLLLPVLPFPASFSPQPICAVAGTVLPPSEAVSPLLLAGLTHASHLLAAADTAGAGTAGAAVVDPVALFDERELALWRRRGPYLTLRCAPQRFEELFAAFLEAGIVINPTFPGPSVLPRWCSRGEFEKFVKVSRMADS